MKHMMIWGGTLMLAACGQADQPSAATNNAVSGSGAAAALQPGEWESRVEILNVKLLPIETPEGTFTPKLESHSPPSTSRSCLTAKEAIRPYMRFLVGSSAADCNTDAFSMANGRIGGTLACTGLGERTTYRLEGRYTATSYDVRTIAEVRAGDSPPSSIIPTATPMDMTSRVTGRRTDDCPTSQQGNAS